MYVLKECGDTCRDLEAVSPVSRTLVFSSSRTEARERESIEAACRQRQAPKDKIELWDEVTLRCEPPLRGREVYITVSPDYEIPCWLSLRIYMLCCFLWPFLGTLYRLRVLGYVKHADIEIVKSISILPSKERKATPKL